MNFTVVCPIHNESEMLPYTLQSIYQLQPDEVIFSLDRCTDKSDEIIHAAAMEHPSLTRVIYYEDKDGKDWTYRPAYLRRTAYREARNNTILNTSADIILDPATKRFLPGITGATIFGFLDRPWTPQCFIRHLAGAAGLHGYSGLIAFSREAWLKTEDQEEVKRIPRAEDTHLLRAIETKYPINYVNTVSFHLRPSESAEDHY